MLVISLKPGQRLQIGTIVFFCRYKNGQIKVYIESKKTDETKIVRETAEEFFKRMRDTEWTPES